MNNIIVNTIDRIMGFAKTPTIKDATGREYFTDNVTPVYLPEYKTLSTSSLQSIIDFVQLNPDLNYIIHVEDHRHVKLVSEPFGEFGQQETYVVAQAMIPKINFDSYLGQEEFMISLLSKFHEGEGRAYAMNIAQGIVEEKEVKQSDNGMGQVIQMRQGVNPMTTEEINPFVNLQPMRTFHEVEQPKSVFLLRIRSGGQLALFEADGGAWKLEANKNIADYLQLRLGDFEGKLKIVY